MTNLLKVSWKYKNHIYYKSPEKDLNSKWHHCNCINKLVYMLHIW
jgi:hypothetical protein